MSKVTFFPYWKNILPALTIKLKDTKYYLIYQQMLNSGGLDGPVFKSSLGPFCMAFPVYTPPVAPTELGYASSLTLN